MKSGEISVGRTYASRWASPKRTVIWLGEHEGKGMVQYTTPDIVLGEHHAPTVSLLAFARWATKQVE